MSAVIAVIDTNILVSALISRNPDSAAVKVLAAVFEKRITPMINDEIMKEYREVLARPKFRLPKDLVSGVSNRVACNEFFPDADDRVFYEVALSNSDAYLVTGNARHFPKARIVVSPAAMLDILRSK